MEEKGEGKEVNINEETNRLDEKGDTKMKKRMEIEEG